MAEFTTQAIPLELIAPIAGPRSVRSRIMDLLVKRLERISHANGFYTDVQDVQHRQQYEDEQLPEQGPIIYVFDSEDQLNEVLNDVEEINITVTVEGWTFVTGASEISNINQSFLMDVLKAIWVDHETLLVDAHFRGLAESMQYARGRLVYGRQDENSSATITEWNITFMQVRGQPHLQSPSL